MKLVLVVLHDEDSHQLMAELTNDGYMATKLASTGGLLKSGNTTLFIGVPESQVEEVVNIIRRVCKTTKKVALINPPANVLSESILSYPVEVTVGGATIFVLEVDKYLKV